MCVRVYFFVIFTYVIRHHLGLFFIFTKWLSTYLKNLFAVERFLNSKIE